MWFSSEAADATWVEPGSAWREPERGGPVLTGNGGGSWGNHVFPNAEKEG
jgi:hypothetical protein